MSERVKLIEDQSTANEQDDALFYTLIERTFAPEPDATLVVSVALDASDLSIQRWRSGRNASYPALRPRVYKACIAGLGGG